MSEDANMNHFPKLWNQLDILPTRDEHVKTLKEIFIEVKKTYKSISDHLETIQDNDNIPSDIGMISKLFHRFDEVNSATDRALLNIYVYVNTIRLKHINRHLDTNHMDKIMGLLQMVTEQRKSLNAVDYSNFFEAIIDTKDKAMDKYNFYVVLVERKTLKTMLNALTGITMIVNFIIEHLKSSPILDHINSDIKSNTGGLYM